MNSTNDRIPKSCPGPRQPGWTMVELMVVITIVTVILVMAYPAYTDQVIKARRADGRALLYEAAQQQQQFYSVNNAYATAIGSGSGQLNVPTTSDEGYYTLTLSGGQTWTLTATRVSPQTADTDCGDLTLNYLGVKGVTNATKSAAFCW